MLKQAQKLKQTQTLSPQQIQFIKLLQVPTIELDKRIQEELMENPVLEEGKEAEKEDNEFGNDEATQDDLDSTDDFDIDDVPDIDPIDEVNIDDYVSNDDIAGYKMYGDGDVAEDKELPIPMMDTLSDSLLSQLSFLNLDDVEQQIGEQLIGSIEADGYIRRPLEAIVNDLAFLQNVETDLNQVEKVLAMIQHFDPPGIGARSLQECLEIQLKRKDTEDTIVKIAIKMVVLCFEEFKKKHYTKIQKRLAINDEQMKDAIDMITHLNPKPGGTNMMVASAQFLTPDFIVKEVNGRINISLNGKNAPDLRVSRQYGDMLQAFDKTPKKTKKMREEVRFVKQKLDAAKWFIDAIKQRQDTLLRTMNAIIDYQMPFFLSGDEGKLKPMILKDIAEIIQMDISTVSRVASSKVVETDFGIYPLKYFFSESISTESGEDVSSKQVKSVLKEMIDKEDKRKPLSDDKLEKLLRVKGYNIARRTVAKYREQMNIPVARMRKEL
ncbi:RNA polymerase factor sigma-54 [Flammeovirga yaeyamensis]|uniref:RNA polymerase factor sigma-54 n=1 Tax=Flammeovirga yaeyamensis TaxID=367791 RepID=A0AAX1N716_9BACT|nr:RNA polymerase factor sigma-54 [Flammeovirga yaeyamensis]MBB3697942.1 RNA polymerase sigma-54 factor [Flammeovirga yaeyamensis]NMF35703.1 RNA polymerase factor sigma-54 [Flammeovirga yaeyamensis]QWG03344.1 RNA polymerase factor sigma-54 [Flammeovirga yaeyamensis]